jgi:hypothetical protein
VHGDGIVWIIGRMEAATLFCTPWFMEPTDELEAILAE